METKGYTLNGVAGRIRDLEHKTNGGYYVALCWLAMARNSGKGAKKLLETKIFGKGKPTSTFRNAWRIADKAFAEGFHAEHRTAVAELVLDEAIKFAVGALEAHKAALGVTSMAEYEAVCKFATQSDIPAASAEATSDEPDAADNEAPEQQAAPVESRPIDVAVAAMNSLSATELVEFAAMVQARLVDLQRAEQLPMAA